MSSRGGSAKSVNLPEARAAFCRGEATRCEHAVTRLRNKNVERARIFRTEIFRGARSLRRGRKRSISPNGSRKDLERETLKKISSALFSSADFQVMRTRRVADELERGKEPPPRSRGRIPPGTREHQLMENGGRVGRYARRCPGDAPDEARRRIRAGPLRTPATWHGDRRGRHYGRRNARRRKRRPSRAVDESSAAAA